MTEDIVIRAQAAWVAFCDADDSSSGAALFHLASYVPELIDEIKRLRETRTESENNND